MAQVGSCSAHLPRKESLSKYQTKIKLASEIITELIDFGFKIELVLADILFCVYLMISLNCQAFLLLNQSRLSDSEMKNLTADFSIHPQGNQGFG